MSCDIHIHQEVKINGKWQHYSYQHGPQHYDLFSVIAGVRGIYAPIKKPCGVPGDMSELTLFDWKRGQGDWHTPTYFDKHDLERFYEAIKDKKRGFGFSVGPCWFDHDTFGYCFGNGWDSYVKYPDSRPEGLEDVRWVIWFDN